MPVPSVCQSASYVPGSYPSNPYPLGFTILTQGDVVLVYWRMDHPGNTGSISDTMGNDWVQLESVSGMACWCTTANAAGYTVISIGNGGLARDSRFIVLEFTAGPASSSSVLSAYATGSSTTPSISSSLGNMSITLSSTDFWEILLIQIPAGDGVSSPFTIAFVDFSVTLGVGSSPPSGWSFFTDFPGAPFSLMSVLIPASLVASDVVTDICVRAGLLPSQIDVSLLTDTYISPNATVPGFLCDRPTAAHSLLSVLMDAYFFDACESSGKVRFIPRGLSAVLSIPEADLGLEKDKAKLTSSVVQDLDLPRRVTVMFNDPALDYQQNKQEKQRNSRLITTSQQIIKQFPLTMDIDWGAQVAEKILYLKWLERNSFVFNLWRAIYLLLDPTDVVQFTYESLTYQVRIVENSIGQGLAVEIQCVSENPNNYESTKAGAPTFGFVPPVTPIAAPTLLYLLDIPLLRDVDANASGTGFYFDSGSQAVGWQGMALFTSPDDSSYGAPIATSAAPMMYGVATNALGSPRCPWEWDETNTLTITVKAGSFQSDTQSNVLNGSNGLLLQSGSGWEVVQYTTAVDNGDGTVTLSGLLRGRRGTEWACGGHAIGDLALALSIGVMRLAEPLSLLGQLRYYRGVTIGQDITSAASQQFTIEGVDLMPYAPCQIGGTVDGSGNITITWLRRTRIGGEADWADGVDDVPLSEDSELYSVDILNGSTVVRTISGLTSPTCVYTAAMQTADFGSAQSQVTVNVYQISGEVGRGYKGVGLAPTSGGWPVPIGASSPGYGQFYVNGS